MELSRTSRGAISNLPHRPFFCTPNRSLLSWKSSLPLKQSFINHTNLGLQYHANSSLKSTTSEETPSSTSQYVKEGIDGEIMGEDVQAVEKNESDGTEDAKEEYLADEQFRPFEFLEKLNMEIDSGSPYPVLLFGGGSLVALWLATAVVGAIDSIPVFPKLMEVVGLAYSLWFCTRYLLFKENRDELTANVEEIKQRILGSNDD